MYSYALLEPECFYLTREKENNKINLIQVKLVSDHCMYVIHYGKAITLHWQKKEDPIFDIIELLSDEAAKQWKEIYYSEDAYYEEDDE